MSHRAGGLPLKEAAPPSRKGKVVRGRYPAMMYEIIILLMVGLATIRMAKRSGSRRRRMGKYLKGKVEEELLLSTLAGKDLIGVVMGETVNERTFVSSIKATWSLSNLTDAFSQGPIVVGYAHSDYTDAEVEAVIEATGSWNEGNLVAQEVMSRKVRIVGAFGTPAQALGIVMLNEGRPITTKLGWILLQGQTVRWWAYNSGSNALATTSAELVLTGHANLWPR